MLHRQFRFSRRGHSAEKPIHPPSTTPPREDLVPIREAENTMLHLLEFFSERLIDDDAVSVRKSPLAEKEYWGNFIAMTELLSVVADAARELCAKDKKASNRANDSQPKGVHNVFAHCPEDPNCEECQMTTTKRARCNN